MATSDPTQLTLLVFFNTLLLAMASIALVRIRQRLQRFEEFWQSPTGAALLESRQATVKVVEKPNAELEHRVAELQCVVRTLAKQEPRHETSADTGLPIENAVRMARHGASIDELIRGCGLNIGEAKLMQKLHGMKRAALN
ncbi:MAG: DUF2802 domain-containing protein [Gammaproteobacteria bacterium]|nr:DUF2802 domain-containing protein [Gammaproteobacteria bacterium]